MGAHSKVSRFKRARSIATVGFMLAAGLVWAGAPAQAVHDTGKFELDGNIVHNGTATWDWGNLFDANGAQTVIPDPDNGPLLASDFFNDSPTESPTTYFSGGGSKDGQPISAWQCNATSVQPKDELTHTYAALVQVPVGAPDNGGHTVLYLGAEKQAAGNGGDNAVGFWLFKSSKIGCAGGGSFSGHHTDGDLLVVSDFTNGGTTSTISVYKWVGDDSGHLNTTPILSGATCGSSTPDDACAIANFNGSITSGPWTSGGTNAKDTFVEAGVDITTVLHGAGGCFTNFLAESRSSQSLTATLSDYASGQFNTCPKPPVTTTASGKDSLNAPGSDQTDTATVASVGSRPTPTGSVSFYLCQPGDVSNSTCPAGKGDLVSTKQLLSGSATSSTVNGASTPNDLATGTYCWRAEYTPDDAASAYYLPSVETDFTNECFTVAHGSPKISTQIAVNSSLANNLPGLGYTSLGDTATLTGFVGSVKDETITFNAYGPYANGVTPTCTGTPTFTTTGALDANGAATTKDAYTPTAAGTYVWVASYPGDALNDGATGKCSDANESVTIVGATIDVSKSANPPGPVSAGATIGFDITVSNSGAVPADGVSVTDKLPATADGVPGGDLNWSLSPDYTNCSITGSVGAQTLKCTGLGPVAGGASLPVIHVQSPTTPLDCGVVKNSASVSTTNGTGGDSDVATVTVLCPHLTIDKTADAPSVNVGSPIGFTITATNDGQGTASGVLINDPLPSGPGIVWSIDAAGTSGPLSCAIQSGTLTCTGTLGSGKSEVVHITSPTVWNADRNSCGKYDNTATASATNSTNSPQDSASESVLCPNIDITKTADAAAVNAGTDIGFTIVATNSGSGDATGVVLSDPLPTGTGITWSIDVAGTSGPLNCVISSGTLTCTGTLGAGKTETVHITSPTQYSSCKTYDNTATLTATNDPQHPSGSDSTKVMCANLLIHKTPDVTDDVSVSVGSDISFTVTVQNTGDGVASGVDVEDPLPSGPGISWSILNQDGPLTCVINGSAPNQTLKCTGTMAAGDQQSVAISSHTQWTKTADTEINSCLGGDGHGVYDNTATVKWSNGPALPISSNEGQNTVLCPNLTFTKTAAAATVNSGESIGFSIEVSNAGPGNATGVKIHDPLPAGDGVVWTIDSVTGASAQDCSITGATGSQTLNCDFGTLLPDDDIVIKIVSNTTASSCGTYDNTATLTTTNVPGDTAEDSTKVLCPHLTIDKTAAADSVNVGEDIGFTVTVTNDGAGTATSIDMEDPLPTGPGISWTIDSQNGPLSCSISPDNKTLSCTGTLLAGQSEVVKISSHTQWTTNADHVTTNSCLGGTDGTGVYDNTATVTASNVAGTPEASDSEAVLCPDLGVTKTADDPTVNAGDNIGFTIVATNSGEGDAKGVVLSDPLPTGPGISWTVDSSTGPLECSIDNDKLTCAGTLAAGDTETVHITSGTAFASCKVYDNSASLTSTNDPQTPAGRDTTTVQCADLVIAKSAAAASVSVGSDIGFTVTIDNNGDGTAFGVDVEDPLPSGPGISWSTGTETGPLDCTIVGSAPSQTLKCTGNMAPGAEETVKVSSSTQWTNDGETEVNSCLGGTEGTGVYDNTASVTWSNGPADPRTASANEAVLCPDLTLTKTAGAETVDAGGSISFTVEVKNTGAGNATGAVLTDPLPAGDGVLWTIDSVTGASAEDCSIDGAAGSQVLTCDLGTLLPGNDVLVKVVSDTAPASCTTYDNTATLTTTNVPGAEDSASTSVLCPHITLTKVADAPVVNDGDPIGFTLTVSNGSNPGTGTGHDVALHDALPGGPAGSDVLWTIDPAYTGPGTCEISGPQGQQVLDCHFGNLPADTSVSVHVQSNSSFASCGDYPNTATETASNDAEHTADATTSVICPVLDSIVVKADDPVVAAGQSVGFTLSGKNNAAHLTTGGGTPAKTVDAVHTLVAPLVASVEPGTVINAVLVSALPADNGISWSIDPAYTGPGTCAIAGPDGSQVLTCQLGNLAPQEGFSVHITSNSSCDVTNALVDKGTLSAANVPDVSSQDTTAVLACAAHVHRPQHHETASTGIPMLGLEITWGIALVGFGGLVLIAARRRRGMSE